MFDAVAEMHVNLKEVAAEDRSWWMPLAHADRVREVFSVAERSEAELVRTVMGWDLAGGPDADGQRTPNAWLAWQLQISRPRAKVLMDSAVVCDKYPDVAAALAAGEIACGHVAAMARIVAKYADDFATCAEGLLGAAAESTVDEFDWVAKRWANAVDQAAPVDERDRGLSVSDTFGGKSYLRGNGSNEEAAILRAALARHAGPDPADCPEGPRTKTQRMWDALIDMARRDLAGDDPTGPADGLDLVADAETVAHALADDHGDLDPQLDFDPADFDPADPGTAAAAAPDNIADILDRFRKPQAPAPTATIPRVGVMGGPPLPPAVIARLLCTAWIRRVIRDPDTGHLLDYGRRHRLYVRHQRRAMAHRDGGCGWIGCDLGPRYCDAHHILPWPQGGLTNIDQGLLLCRRHHHLIHDKGWTLGRDPTSGIVTITAPDGRTFSHRPDPLARRV